MHYDISTIMLYILCIMIYTVHYDFSSYILPYYAIPVEYIFDICMGFSAVPARLGSEPAACGVIDNY